mmetsp:Transcript_53248/g.122368  ORF Transcript_53248/g.122368 Transcript_53248/m.122368 type:complete len:318 (+) Transcript_53248:1318-2271(+)
MRAREARAARASTARRQSGETSTEMSTARVSEAKVCVLIMCMSSAAVAMINANSPHALIAKPTVAISVGVRGTAKTPVSSLPVAASEKSSAEPTTRPLANSRTGISNPTVAAKKRRNSHCSARFTCRVKPEWRAGSEQSASPARKVPSRCEVPRAWQSGTSNSARQKSRPSSAFSARPRVLLSARRLSSAAVTRGLTKRATTTASAISRTDEQSGNSKETAGVPRPMACSIASNTSATTSSSTAAAMINWPVGVLSTLAALSTLRAMPIDVGASVHDTAREACHECPSAKARPKPIHIGVADPTRATTTPRAPIGSV